MDSGVIMMNKTNKILVHAFSIGYRVDDEGNVYNLLNKEIKTRVSGNGYRMFSFRINGVHSSVYVHRLLAYQLFGDKIFKNGIHVRHLNGNPIDNSINNISIGTASDNAMDKNEIIRLDTAVKASRSFQDSKRSKKEREEIYKAICSGVPFMEIIEMFKVSKGTLSYMKNKSLEYKEYCS